MVYSISGWILIILNFVNNNKMLDKTAGLKERPNTACDYSLTLPN